MNRLRILLFALVCAVAVAVASVAVAVAVRRADRATQPTLATKADRTLAVADVRRGSYIAFRSTALGPTYGKLAFVPLDKPGGPRAVTGIDCERSYVTRQQSLCLSADRGVVTTYQAQLLDAGLKPGRQLPISGIPSRARLGDGGRLAATTTFVSGHSYAQAGFSTATTVYETTTGQSHGNLEEFRVIHQGKRYKSVDLNVWGVTFVDARRFYATVASKGRTWLATGDLAARTLTTLDTQAECPSVSPDRTRVAYKKRLNPSRPVWRLHVLDLRTGQETTLAEPHSVDDQVEWLDDEHVLYGLPRAGAETDIWTVPANGSGQPRLLVPYAWSPSVVR